MDKPSNLITIKPYFSQIQEICYTWTMANFETVCGILGELYTNYGDSKEFKGFVEFNDLGLPLAFLTSEGLIVELSDDGRRYVIDTLICLLDPLK